MARALAPRLTRADYIGQRAFLLTICTYRRAGLLNDRDLVESLLIQFRESSITYCFATHAYCFMPDHVHFVIEGQCATSDCYALVKLWKSKTAFRFKRGTGRRLWHRSYYDRAMRDHDDVTAFAKYVIENPARAGMSEERCPYPFVGSDTTTVEKLLRRELPRTEFSRSIV